MLASVPQLCEIQPPSSRNLPASWWFMHSLGSEECSLLQHVSSCKLWSDVPCEQPQARSCHAACWLPTPFCLQASHSHTDHACHCMARLSLAASVFCHHCGGVWNEAGLIPNSSAMNTWSAFQQASVVLWHGLSQ